MFLKVNQIFFNKFKIYWCVNGFGEKVQMTKEWKDKRERLIDVSLKF